MRYRHTQPEPVCHRPRMQIRLRPRTVPSRSGEVWIVARRWLPRPLPRWRRMPAGETATRALAEAAGLEDLAASLMLAVAAIVVIVILIPLLLFGIELIIVGFVLAAAILGRAL